MCMKQGNACLSLPFIMNANGENLLINPSNTTNFTKTYKQSDYSNI